MLLAIHVIQAVESLFIHRIILNVIMKRTTVFAIMLIEVH